MTPFHIYRINRALIRRRGEDEIEITFSPLPGIAMEKSADAALKTAYLAYPRYIPGQLAVAPVNPPKENPHASTPERF